MRDKPMRKYDRPLTILAVLMCLAGCTSLRQQPSVDGTPDRALQTRLSTIHRWSIEGKLAVHTAQASDSARLQWQQDGQTFDIHLSGPAGLKATHVYGFPGNVVFEQGDQHERAASAEILSEKLVGWPLPAAELTAWILGLPASHSRIQHTSYTKEGLLAELAQDKWEIHFSDYRKTGDVMLPGKIEAVRNETRITLIVKRWVILQ